MTSFGDLISDANGIMYQGKYDSSTNDKLSAFKLWNFGLKAAPKAGTTVAHAWTKQSAWDGEKKTSNVSEKNSTKLGFKHDDVKWDVALANDKYSVKVGGPLSKDDWKADGDLSWEEKPGKTRKIEANLAIESPDMSGANAAINFGVEQEMAKGKEGYTNADPKLKFDACLNVEKDWYVGFAAEHNTKEADGIEAAIMKRDGDNKYWLGYDHSNQFAKLGCL